MNFSFFLYELIIVIANNKKKITIANISDESMNLNLLYLDNSNNKYGLAKFGLILIGVLSRSIYGTFYLFIAI